MPTLSRMPMLSATRIGPLCSSIRYALMHGLFGMRGPRGLFGMRQLSGYSVCKGMREVTSAPRLHVSTSNPAHGFAFL